MKKLEQSKANEKMDSEGLMGYFKFIRDVIEKGDGEVDKDRLKNSIDRYQEALDLLEERAENDENKDTKIEDFENDDLIAAYLSNVIMPVLRSLDYDDYPLKKSSLQENGLILDWVKKKYNLE